MNYKAAYFRIFNQLTDLIALLEGMDPAQEELNIILCLKQIQRTGEELCTTDAPIKARRVG